MTVEVIADLDEIETGEWLRLRAINGIGGSEAGVLAGLSKWEQPYGLWSRKVGDRTKTAEQLSAIEDEETKEYQTWGHLLEDPIAAEFSRRTGIETHVFKKMARNTEYPFAFANVDRLTGPRDKLDGVLEIKTTRFADDWNLGLDGAVQVPLQYAVQGQHYLAVLGLPVVHYACLIGGQQMVVAEVERNDSLIADLMAIEESFWQDVIDQNPPPVDNSEATTRALRNRWQPDPDKTVELPPEFTEVVQLRASLTAEAKRVKEELAKVDNTVMALLGDAEVGLVNGTKVVTWKGSTRNTIDTAALKEAQPSLAAEFSRTTSVRTLRFSTVKGEE